MKSGCACCRYMRLSVRCSTEARSLVCSQLGSGALSSGAARAPPAGAACDSDAQTQPRSKLVVVLCRQQYESRGSLAAGFLGLTWGPRERRVRRPAHPCRLRTP